jgi:LysR family transcriptional activator of glutamate synthase operon
MPEVTLMDSLPRATVKIPVVNPGVTRTIGVICPAQRKLLPTEELFYNFLSEFYSKEHDRRE